MRIEAFHFDKYLSAAREATVTHDVGKITEVSGLALKAFVTGCGIGSLCEIQTQGGRKKILAEVIGFRGREVVLMPLKDCQGVSHGCRVTRVRSRATLNVGRSLLGRVLNGLGEPIDDLGPVHAEDEVLLYREAVSPLDRSVIKEPLSVGVRSIDSLLTVGRGQRVGIMAGSGVGKSILLGMMARATEADVNVIALIGERGREVKEFIESSLGPEGLARSVIIAVTSDQSPLLRTRGAFIATAISEYFAQSGLNVLLMMDSVTRFAMAQREVGLSAGEPPTAKGYTPSVFSLLPKLLERAGSFMSGGSITGLYTVLVEGDDMDDPIADSVRSIVDGHIVLDRKLAHRGYFPAIDVLKSTSRVMYSIIDQQHKKAAQMMRECLATYAEAEDLINIGAYRAGSNPKIDNAIKNIDGIQKFLKQDINDKSTMQTALRDLQKVMGL